MVKLHHAFTDGVGAVRLALALFDLSAIRNSDPMPPRPDEPSSTDIERTWDDIDYEVRRTLSVARRALPWLARGVRETLAAPDDRVRRALDLIRSTSRVSAPGSRPMSDVMTGRSLGSRLQMLTMPLDALQAAGRAAAAPSTTRSSRG